MGRSGAVVETVVDGAAGFLIGLSRGAFSLGLVSGLRAAANLTRENMLPASRSEWWIWTRSPS
jgi:hypothetical protein